MDLMKILLVTTFFLLTLIEVADGQDSYIVDPANVTNHPTAEAQQFVISDQHPTDPVVVSLEESINRALACAPSIQQAASEIEVADGKAVQKGLKPNPVFGYRGSQINRGGKAGEHGMYIRQKVVTGNKLGIARSVHHQESHMAASLLESQRKRIEVLATLRYFEVLAAQEMIDAYNSRMDRLRIQRSKFGGPTIPPSINTLLTMEGLKTDAELQVARSNRLKSLRALAATTAMDRIDDVVLVDIGDYCRLPEWQACLNYLYENSPELSLVNSRVERERQNSCLEVERQKPDIYLEGAVQYDDLYSRPQATFQIGIPLRIHDRNQGNIRSSRARLTRASLEIERMKNSIHDRLLGFYEAAKVAGIKATTLVDYVTKVKSVYSFDLRIYHDPPVGESPGYFPVVEQDRQILEWELAQIKAKYDQARNIAIINSCLLTDDFQEPSVIESGVRLNNWQR